MKVPDGSCGSAIGAEQLTFIYGDIADRRHVRFENKNSTCVMQKQENFGLHCKKYGMIKMKTIFILT